MGGLANYCLQLSRSQGMLDLRASIGNYNNMSILRGVAPPSGTSVTTQIIRMPPDGVLWFVFHINVNQGYC